MPTYPLYFEFFGFEQTRGSNEVRGTGGNETRALANCWMCEDTFTCAKVNRHGSPLSLEYSKMQEAAHRGETLKYLHI